jgi:murein DD-endopeptidase MepM/ murein hydrolase activator NlpD
MKALVGCIIVILFFITPASGSGPVWDIGQVSHGQSLYSSLEEKQLSPGNIRHIVKGLKPYMNFGRIRPNTAYHFILDPMGKLQEFTIEWRGDLLHLYGGSDRYTVRRWKVPRSMRIDTVRGQFEEDLREAFRTAGQAGDLPERFAEILSQDTEPAVELKKGDQFRLVVEKMHAGQWLMRYGTIEAFELQRQGSAFLAIRFKDDFYDDQGRSLKTQFLRFPLHYDFVSSEFMKMRRHPILGGVRPHRGIDLVAPLGTPVWAVADGQVVNAQWMSGYGQTVILRHAKGYESLYAHLSGFTPEVRKGATVLKKQVIGFIGTTGLSTGPHLHFELKREGRPLDPLKEIFPRTTLTHPEDIEAFSAKKKMIQMVLAADKDVHIAFPDVLLPKTSVQAQN